jgi:APA family basic amino acid/polyamine antiporter
VGSRDCLLCVFLGFDAVATLAQEAKNPQRDMPVGMIGSLVDLLDSSISLFAFRDDRRNSVYSTLGVPVPVGVAN